jgi:hypothetical protein
VYRTINYTRTTLDGMTAREYRRHFVTLLKRPVPRLGVAKRDLAVVNAKPEPVDNVERQAMSMYVLGTVRALGIKL